MCQIAVRVRVATYVPATVEVGTFSARPAARCAVPRPPPAAAVARTCEPFSPLALTSVIATPLAGLTTAPSVRLCTGEWSTTFGDQPRFSPLMPCEPPSEKSDTWPDSVQPGLPARLSVTVTGLSAPEVVNRSPLGFITGEGRVTWLSGTLMTSVPAVTVVVMVSEPDAVDTGAVTW